jgi:hypothetical protein
MKIKSFALIMLIALLIFFIVSGTILEKKRETNILLIPSLPRPIAKEYALITSAGQSTDAYIIGDVANKLMIHNYFMPEANERDLEGVNTLVFVVGYSSLGKRLHDISYEEEKKRIIELLKKSEEKNLVVITVYIGGKERCDKNTEELLRLICPKTDYLIGTKEANSAYFLSDLTKGSRIPLTLIDGVNGISEPFASAFR